MEVEKPELGLPESAEDILENATLCRQWLRSRANDIEELRQLPADVVRLLTQSGVFRMSMPRDWGGPELTSMQQVSVIEMLSRGYASAGWCAMIGSDSGLYSGYLDDTVARDLYPFLDVVQAGWIYPVGIAEEIDGGYRVSGEWMFGSGSGHADIIAAGCFVHKGGEPALDADGKPIWRIMLAPASHWQLHDNWFTTGLRGTGSNNYSPVSQYLIVPREHSFSFSEARREGLLWQSPEALLRKMSGVPLGVARQAIEDFKDIMQKKSHRLSGASYLSMPRVQAVAAEAEMILGAARSYVYASLEAQWQTLASSKNCSRQIRADIWLSRLNAFQAARSIARLLYDTVGGDAIYTLSSNLDRAVRDTETMCQHWVAQKVGLESVGGMIFDVEGPAPRSIML